MFYFAIGSLIVGLVIARAIGQRRKLPELGSNEWMALQQGLPPTLADDPALNRYVARTRRWRLLSSDAISAGFFHLEPASSTSIVPLHTAPRSE